MGQQGPLLALMAMRRSAVVQVDWDAEVPYRDPKTGFCVALPKGQIGELITLLDAEDVGSRFQGYHNNPEANMKKVLRDVFKKGDAWYRSGDVIRIDKENRIYFSDRIGDTFRLVLAGRADAYDQLWSPQFETVARAARAPDLAIDRDARVDQRLSLCGI
ncbi:MAG: hypothetical protein M1823_007598, partial [Watsoniomyces obsoletus]